MLGFICGVFGGGNCRVRQLRISTTEGEEWNIMNGGGVKQAPVRIRWWGKEGGVGVVRERKTSGGVGKTNGATRNEGVQKGTGLGEKAVSRGSEGAVLTLKGTKKKPDRGGTSGEWWGIGGEKR